MPANVPTTLLLMIASMGLAKAAIGNWEGCGGRLERALDALRRDSTRRTRLKDDDHVESGIIYQQILRSAPLEMTVSRVNVKLPQDTRGRGGPWAQVERCVYEPSNNSLQTRLSFNDLTVSGRVSLLPLDYRAPIPAESCRMTLRLRRAGIDFFTSPIARGRGQMRIRTESSFLEPRFASIYAFGCRPTRGDKQIKRQDKWPPLQTILSNSPLTLDDVTDAPLENQNNSDDYQGAEPRGLPSTLTEEDIVVGKETRKARDLFETDLRPGIWRKSDWVTRSSSSSRRRRNVADITPQDFALALAKKARSLLSENTESSTSLPKLSAAKNLQNFHENKTTITGENLDLKINYKRETTEAPDTEESQRPRELLLEEDLDNINLAEDDFDGRGWQVREGVTREMEDVFLKGASQALTSYIERQLHPAIKETLMLSMGFTVSYG
ncbi:uncharacterized protein LOC105688334 [Athalia rosae]|uniref:uncharacterized protein LOC105688334 n=1 Tax=Athalia rosae TaxID=37344 RepID=UPI002034714B|nr:uncharacterized protein LOC105688334 [Athalia rosae]XP_048507225.1 uncharacterized protein LOC105688334 [Athalia rosae]